MARPNILFIFSDQQHGQAMGYHDRSFTTPALDSLIQQSTLFARAYCTCPQCSPSRSSMLTGYYPHHTRVQGNVGASGGEPLRIPTIAHPIKAAGYRTAYFGKWHLGKEPVATGGWDENLGVTGPETTNDHEVTRRAIDFLNASGSDARRRPFALFLAYNNPHDIYQFSQGVRTDQAVASPPDPDDLTSKPPVQRQFMDDDQGRIMAGTEADEWLAYRALYREMTRRYDEHVGAVIAAMKRQHLLEQTFVVATSDHGDMDGAHGLIYKGPFMYEQVTRVPLMIRLPDVLGGPAHQKTDELVVNTDIFPTLLQVAGASPSSRDGNSLLPLVTGIGSAARREFVIGQYYGKQRWINPIRMLRTRRWKLNRYGSGEMELYDLEADPGELRNLATWTTHVDVIRSLSASLDEWLLEHNDPFTAQSPTTREGEPPGL